MTYYVLVVNSVTYSPIRHPTTDKDELERWARRTRYDDPNYYTIREATPQEVDRGNLSEDVWTIPVWYHEPFWPKDSTAHICPEDPTMIEFRNERGHLVRMRPGKYLKRFHPDLTDKQVAFYAEWWARGKRPPRDLTDLELKYATDPDEIVHVYAEGPHSCMKEEDAVKVYGAGDLAIAYLQDINGQIVARCLCWPEKKVFGRCYPNDEDDEIEDPEGPREALFDLMRSHGFQHISEGGSFDGARLLKIKHGREYVVMPYLDGGYCFKVGKDYLYMSYGNGFSGSSTDGYTYFEDIKVIECHHCGEECDDFVTARGDLRICTECAPEHTFICHYRDQIIYGEEPVVMFDGIPWSQSAFERHGFVDPADGQNYPEWMGTFHNNQLHYIAEAA